MINNSGSRRRALIIGISDYDKLEPLAFCKNDGKEMRDVLLSLNYNIFERNTLLGRVEWGTMRDAIYDFFSGEDLSSEDTLIFYYSGHGIQSYLDGNIYLAPSEIDPDLPFKRGFSFNDLRTTIQGSVATRVVAILDCCHSGSANISKGDKASPPNLILSINENSKVLEQGEGKCILAASQSYQNAYLFEEKGHSIFTYFLLEALKGNKEAVDNNGFVTPYSLNKYIFKKINSLPSKMRPRQKPLMKAETSGDIVLAYYPQLAKKISPDHPAPSIDNADIINKGNRYLDNREYYKALEYYEKIVSDPNLAKAWNNKGLALLQLRKYEESLQAIEISIGLDPDNAHAWSNKGVVLHNLHRFNEAIKSFQKSIDLNPEFPRWDLYAICLIREKKYDEAWKYLDKASELDMDSDSLAIVWYGKGDILNEKQKHDAALACYDKAIKAKPTFAAPWFEKGLILKMKQKYNESLACFDKAIEYSNKSIEFPGEMNMFLDESSVKAVWSSKALLLYDLQRYDEALKSVDKIIEFDPNDSAPWAIRGRILNDLQRYDEAIVSLDKLLQLNPSHAAGWSNKGIALLQKGKYDESIKCFEKSIKLDPTNETFSSNKLYAIKLRENRTRYYIHKGKPIKYYTSSGKPVYI